MPRNETLARSRDEIARGDAEQAKRRLLGLLSTYPDDLEVRQALADAYRALGDSEQSGRWRYLCTAHTPEDESDRVAFENWARQPWHRLSLLRWPPDAAGSDEAAALIRELQQRATAERRRQNLGCWLTFLGVVLVFVALVLLVRWGARVLL